MGESTPKFCSGRSCARYGERTWGRHDWVRDPRRLECLLRIEKCGEKQIAKRKPMASFVGLGGSKATACGIYNALKSGARVRGHEKGQTDLN